MASSNKAQDPAAAALLAIEEALNLRAVDQGAGPGEASGKPIGADKAKGRLPGDREAMVPRPDSSRGSRVRPTTIVDPPARFFARFRPVTIGARRLSSRLVRFCGLSSHLHISSPTALSFSIFRPRPCCLRKHSPS